MRKAKKVTKKMRDRTQLVLLGLDFRFFGAIMYRRWGGRFPALIRRESNVV